MADSQSWKKATSGTYVDRAAPHMAAVVFATACLVLALIPFAGMAWAPTNSTTENRQLAEFPQLVSDDGVINVDILSDFGTYFDDHFALRNQAVSANAYLRAALDTSATDQVVLGDDGWLYYGGELPDYLGQGQLSDRALAAIAHNLKLAQDYTESHDAAFAFTLAPNKSSLDDSHMPYYYVGYEGPSNAERLKPYLEAEGVNYVDLFSLFEGRLARGDAFEYLKTDSHWNNRWALLASEELLGSVGHDILPVHVDSAQPREDFLGDLQTMLYPVSQNREVNYYFSGYNDGPSMTGAKWSYVEGSDVTDSTIVTAAAQGAGANGSVLMFRDSFGNALVPYWASAYESATFSKLVPYNLTQEAQLQPDAVVIERAERHLDYLATNPPIMPNPAQRLSGSAVSGATEVEADTDVSTSGSYWVVRGSVAGARLDASSSLRVVVKTAQGEALSFDPFWTCSESDDGELTDDQGFMLYVPNSTADLSDASISVYVL